MSNEVIEFKDGLFFNLDNDMSIRVDHQDPKTKLLTDILIYDTRNTNINGKMGTIVADSGYISLSDDKRFLLATLYNGEMHEEVRNYQWMKDNTLERRYFDVYNMVIPMSGFDFSRTDMSLFNNSQTKNTKELSAGIDSLEKVSAAAASERSTPLSEENIDGHMLFGMMGKNCRTTIINGRVLYKDREFVGIDEDKINAWTMAESKKLWSTLNDRAY
mgnify:CR=1 FL=1